MNQVYLLIILVSQHQGLISEGPIKEKPVSEL